ncbi:unnamed protein product [Effrenium voratum]|uniref:glutathione gamma-glutamylcysteinyltransferase n=1 Tax=Effrenium voratum TaxID=2562239 RepID=A0AA36J525_9DINO|nr:unnamed protein product [Effrenium voratum]
MPFVPMFHVLSWGTPFALMMLGVRTVLSSRFMDPASLVRMMIDWKVNLATGVPTVWQGVRSYIQQQGVETLKPQLSTLNRLTCGGSAPQPELMRWFLEQLGVEFLQGWGMTETNPMGSIAQRVVKYSDVGKSVEESFKNVTKAGIPNPCVRVRIAKPEDLSVELPQGEAGELLVRGPWIIQEYFHTEAPDKFHDGWLVTGDVAKIDEEGAIVICDRSKDVVKSGGEWISSIDMENMIMSMAEVEMAAVVGIPHPRWDERPIAVATLASGASKENLLEKVRQHLSKAFAKFQLPDDVLVWEAIPLTSTGKIDKKLIRAKLKEQLVSLLVEILAGRSMEKQAMRPEQEMTDHTGTPEPTASSSSDEFFDRIPGLSPSESEEEIQCSRSAQLENHLRGTCRPCRFFHLTKSGCRAGDECPFCHVCSWEEAKAARAKQKSSRRSLERKKGRETRTGVDSDFPVNRALRGTEGCTCKTCACCRVGTDSSAHLARHGVHAAAISVRFGLNHGGHKDKQVRQVCVLHANCVRLHETQGDDRETVHFPRLGKRVENNGQALDVMARRQAGFGPESSATLLRQAGAVAALEEVDGLALLRRMPQEGQAAFERWRRAWEPQQNGTFCGPASALAGLRVLGLEGSWSQLKIYEEVIYPRRLFTQGLSFANGVEMLKMLDQRLDIVERSSFDEALIATLLQRDLSDAFHGGEPMCILVNYFRLGGGHWSPLAGWSDGHVLILDTNQQRLPPHWVITLSFKGFLHGQ